MSLRPKLQNIRARQWSDVRNSWLANAPTFPGIASVPDPGLEHLQSLLDVELTDGRLSDVPGLRSQTVWEAVFLFHKCAHTNLAAQRLGMRGMHSWCLFNAYHAAYLGARGIATILGVPLPELKSRQVALDLFPEPLNKKRQLPVSEFLVIQVGKLDQRDVWEVFQRIVRMTSADCWDTHLRQALIGISHEKISPPRNKFLYRAAYWPLGDLSDDVNPADMTELFGDELDTEEIGFLLRLSLSIYRLFEQLMEDLASYSGSVRDQIDASRFLIKSGVPEMKCYEEFLLKVTAVS